MKKVLLLLGVILSTAPSLAGPQDPCGRSVYLTTNPLLSKVWNIGGTVIYEQPAGLSLTPSRSAPQYRFNAYNEVLLAAFPAASGTYALVTRKPNGFAFYRWSSQDKLVYLYSQKVALQDGLQTYLSPVVDAMSDGSTIYLLTNFELLTLPQAAFVSGLYQPTKERLPGCDSIGASCLRGAGLFIRDNILFIAQMSQALGNIVHLSTARTLGAGTGKWSNSNIFPSQVGYSNILKSPSTENNPGTRLLVTSAFNRPVLNGGDPKLQVTGFAGYPIAMSRLTPTDPSSFTGAVSLYRKGTYYYKNGTVQCQLFSADASALVLIPGASVNSVAAVFPDKTVYTTTVP